MASTAFTVQQASLVSGTLPTAQAIDSTNGNNFANNGKVRIRFNGAASATGTVTLIKSQKCSDGFSHNAVSLANALDTTTEFLEFGPFPPDKWNDPSGLIQITYAGTVTGITANVIQDA